MIKDHGHAVEVLAKCLPYFNMVTSISFSDSDTMRFTWKGNKYKLTLSNASVEEVHGHLLHSTSTCDLMSAIIKLQLKSEL